MSKLYRQTIVIEVELDDDDNPMNETEIEICLGVKLQYLSTQRQVNGQWLFDDMGNLKDVLDDLSQPQKVVVEDDQAHMHKVLAPALKYLSEALERDDALERAKGILALIDYDAYCDAERQWEQENHVN